MAEVLGTISSALAVAEVGLKVGGTMLKLRELWKEVQGVPETIRDLMREIDIMEPLLADIERDLQDDTSLDPSSAFNPAPGRMSASFCQEPLRELQGLVRDLSAGIGSAKKRKRGIAKVKVLLRKEDLNKFQSRLERAVRLLQSAQLHRMSAHLGQLTVLVKSQPQIIVQQVNNHIEASNAKQCLPAEPTKPEENTTQVQQAANTSTCYERNRLPWTGTTYFGRIVTGSSRSQSSSTPTWMARFQPPKWLSQRAWELNAKQACSGWQFNIISFNIVPDDSPVFDLVYQDDWNSLRELFRQGLASPYDCDPCGNTPFDFACDRGSTSVVEGLLQSNEVINRYPMARNVRFFLAQSKKTIHWGMAHRLVGLVADENVGLEPNDVNFGDVLECLSRSSNPLIDGFLELQLQAYFPGWDNLRPAEKVNMLFGDREEERNVWEANIIRRLVRQHGPIQLGDILEWEEEGLSLVHWVWTLFGMSPYYPTLLGKQDWTQLLMEAIEAGGDDLHMRQGAPWIGRLLWSDEEVDTWTPLYCFFVGILRTRVLEAKHVVRGLRVLLAVLDDRGIDLVEYGRREFEIWRSELGAVHMEAVSCVKFLSWDWYVYVWWQRPELMEAIHYGPTPEDWFISWDRYQDYPEAFWNMVENPPRVEVMPGTWVDED